MQRISVCVALAVAAAAATAACTPTSNQHGYVADDPDLMQVQVGVDTMDTVRARLGNPSTQAAFDESAWYYLTSMQQRFAFFEPDTVERTVLAIRFDEQQIVSSVERFGLERGRVVNYASAETPTRGRELGILEQLLGSVGRGVPIGLGDEEQGRPGR